MLEVTLVTGGYSGIQVQPDSRAHIPTLDGSSAPHSFCRCPQSLSGFSGLCSEWLDDNNDEIITVIVVAAAGTPGVLCGARHSSNPRPLTHQVFKMNLGSRH